MSAHFPEQHRSLVDLAETILAVANDAGPGAAARLTQSRLALSREITEHCGSELSVLNARPVAKDAATTELVRRYHDDLLRWRHDLIACNSDWPPKRVFGDPAGFRRAFEPITERLRQRVRWEEEVFYPAVLYARAA